MLDDYNLKKKSDKELCEWTSSWKNSSDKHLMGMREINKRDRYMTNSLSWLAILIAVLSLILSIYRIN